MSHTPTLPKYLPTYEYFKAKGRGTMFCTDCVPTYLYNRQWFCENIANKPITKLPDETTLKVSMQTIKLSEIS